MTEDPPDSKSQIKKGLKRLFSKKAKTEQPEPSPQLGIDESTAQGAARTDATSNIDAPAAAPQRHEDQVIDAPAQSRQAPDPLSQDKGSAGPSKSPSPSTLITSSEKPNLFVKPASAGSDDKHNRTATDLDKSLQDQEKTSDESPVDQPSPTTDRDSDSPSPMMSATSGPLEDVPSFM